MSNQTMEIETVDSGNFLEVLPLIAAYQEFYKAVPSEQQNTQYFARFLKNYSQGILFLARSENGAPAGMATLYFVPSSVRACIQCLLNDLYVVPNSRRMGVGRALIEHCRSYAREHGYGSLVWVTAADNHTAQRLYDGLPTERSEWAHYRLPTDR